MDIKKYKADRKSLRLKTYDYTQPGYYFITICCHNKQHLFGAIKNNQMHLNLAGFAVNECWYQIPEHYPNVILLDFVIMPNHVHGIIEITNQGQLKSKTIGSIVRGFKIGVTKWFRQNLKNTFPIGKSIWQRNYWEHVIRNQESYIEIAQYIKNNPLSWEKDELNS